MTSGGKPFKTRAVATPNKKASVRWQDSAPPVSGYWPTSESNAG